MVSVMQLLKAGSEEERRNFRGNAVTDTILNQFLINDQEC